MVGAITGYRALLFFASSPEHFCVRVCHGCARARWNQLDLAIVLLSVMGITLEEIEINAALPINPTIIRIMRVLRIARGTRLSESITLSRETRLLVSMSLSGLLQP